VAQQKNAKKHSNTAVEMRNAENIYSGITEEDIKWVLSAEKGYREEERKKMTSE
jgi:hypothetical protein